LSRNFVKALKNAVRSLDGADFEERLQRFSIVSNLCNRP